MTSLFSSALETLDDASPPSGVVMGLKVEIVVGMCLLSGHGSEDSGGLSLHQNIQEGNLVVGLLFHSELNGGVLVC